MDIEVAGERLRLLPQCAAFHAASGTLLVADAHFGKAVSFRRLGVPVPGGTTHEMLHRLDACLVTTGARRMVFLGDLLHGPHALAAGTLDAFARWRGVHAEVELTLVRGNHDARSGDPPPQWRIHACEGPLQLGAFWLQHAPEPPQAGYVLAGHVHPCAWVGGRGHDRLRLPCFHFGERLGLLPAFGGFTGMHAPARGPADRVWVIAEDEVHALPMRGGGAVCAPAAYTRAPS